ncbi:MAG: hypothetical protein HOY79_13550 [Streptomyces sp.]|nr:hypothetical protein [Streptomyces sp.]
MLRTILWSLLAAYLIAIGLWHSAAAPVSLAFAGLAVLIGLVPAYVWVVAVGAIWWRHRRTTVVPVEVA